MAERYFSEREEGIRPRVELEVGAVAWGGLVVLIEGLVANGALGVDFPEQCPDGRGPTGTNAQALALSIRAEIPQLDWPLQPDSLPGTVAIMDLLEFCYDHVAEPIPDGYHSFFGHHHLRFDREQGQEQFRGRVDRILSRNHLAFQLDEKGIVSRLAPPILHEVLSSHLFDTGDAKLDELMETARLKILDRDPAIRREELEKLWDAWERVKTIEGNDKKTSTRVLLDKTAGESRFRELLEDEARSVTDVGNRFHIRHSEIGQVEIQSDAQVDYLFHRLFALIWLLLRAR